MKKALKFSLLLSVLLPTTACGSLQDVNHKWCPPETIVEPAPKLAVAQPTTERIDLAADVLFEFNKATPHDLLPAGKDTLDKHIKSVATGYSSVDKINVVGYPDRLGSESYNHKLGLERAKAVQDYLRAGGVSCELTVSSRGGQEPVTTDCLRNKATQSLKACLQPDRRVTLEITGLKKR